MFLVIENTPGYLPESDTWAFDTYAEACEGLEEKRIELRELGYDIEEGWTGEGNYAAFMARGNDGMPDRWVGVVKDEEEE